VTFLHSSRDLLLTALLTASALSFFTMPFSGHLSDRFGRKRIYLIGAVGVGVFGFVYFALLNTMVPGWMFLAIVPCQFYRPCRVGPGNCTPSLSQIRT
jgi:MFS family permease